MVGDLGCPPANLYRFEHSTNHEATERRCREWETTRGRRRSSAALYFLRGWVQKTTRVWRSEGYSSASSRLWGDLAWLAWGEKDAFFKET